MLSQLTLSLQIGFLQLVSDVPALVAKYVKDNAGWPDLDREYKKAVRMMKKKKKKT